MFRVFNKYKKKGQDFSHLKFGFRGEEIEYSKNGKNLEIGFTHIDGQRIYLDKIDKWENGESLTKQDKENVFNDALRFVCSEYRRKAIIVINKDDKFFELWTSLCATNKSLIKKIEFTSNEENEKFEYEMYLGMIQARKKVTFGDITVMTKAELDKYWKENKNINA